MKRAGRRSSRSTRRGPARIIHLVMRSFGLLAGIAAPFLAWGLSVIPIVTWPGYDPIAGSISVLANAPLGWVQTLAFAVSGILGLAWAAALPGVLGATPRDRGRVRALLVLQSALAIGFAIFPTDLERPGITPVGKVHLAIFFTYAVTMPVTLLVLGRVMARDGRWRRFARPTSAAGVLVIAASALVPVTLYGPLEPWLGLLERTYVAIPSIWQVGVGVAAWRVRHQGRDAESGA